MITGQSKIFQHTNSLVVSPLKAFVIIYMLPNPTIKDLYTLPSREVNRCSFIYFSDRFIGITISVMYTQQYFYNSHPIYGQDV